MSGNAFHELAPPPEVLEQGGEEFLRAIFSEGGISIAMQRAFAEPETWGLVLVSLARQAAQVYAEDEDASFDEMMERICLTFVQEMTEEPDADDGSGPVQNGST